VVTAKLLHVQHLLGLVPKTAVAQAVILPAQSLLLSLLLRLLNPAITTQKQSTRSCNAKQLRDGVEQLHIVSLISLASLVVAAAVIAVVPVVAAVVVVVVEVVVQLPHVPVLHNRRIWTQTTELGQRLILHSLRK
jgi:hypothetical protein